MSFLDLEVNKTYLQQTSSVLKLNQAATLSLVNFRTCCWGMKGQNHVEGVAQNQGEVDVGKVEASLPIRGEVKQMTPDTGRRSQEGSALYWILFSPRGQL